MSDALLDRVVIAMSHNDTGFRNYKGYEGMAKAAIAVCLTQPSPVTIERELLPTPDQVVVDRADVERISATWGPSLDEASPADLTIYDRLRDALAERDDDAI